ncbi:hypothetical protein LTR56_012842 [Elasticomyces elasticus]|nr:hypothetical protein LTR56_012842 [Elasticomyces elasticus]KAK3650768.1 hypothetical protein LTR22_012367 [Elasticomyces elasticus]KAK4918472.1 hypothetical protein LTR49_013705 [Elasticomyces elasticus]KAK5757888.1 hypothetical protein LTS12_012072 [Elasticomyces elasticus]
MQDEECSKAGYTALATVMGPFHRMRMYKRFAALSAHNLLLQQAEVLDLESQLQAQVIADRKIGLPYERNARSMIESGRISDKSGHQWRLVLQIREKLSDYNAALLQQAEIAKLTQPREYDRRLLQDWLARKDGGDNFLLGAEDRPWLESESGDLVALSNKGHDSFTHWIGEKLVPLAADWKLIQQAC